MINFNIKCDIIYKALKQGLTVEVFGNPLSLAAGAKAADVAQAADCISEQDFMQIAAHVAINEVKVK